MKYLFIVLLFYACNTSTTPTIIVEVTYANGDKDTMVLKMDVSDVHLSDGSLKAYDFGDRNRYTIANYVRSYKVLK